MPIQYLLYFLVLLLISCTDNTTTSNTSSNTSVATPSTESVPHYDATIDYAAMVEESFLKTFYDKQVIIIDDNILSIALPFDLHSPDCIALDCYTTEVSGTFELQESFAFPPTIAFKVHQQGDCLEAPITDLHSIFKLEKEAATYVLYYSNELQSALVLFESIDISGALAFFFEDVRLDQLDEETIVSVLRDYNREDEDSIYPYLCSVLEE